MVWLIATTHDHPSIKALQSICPHGLTAHKEGETVLLRDGEGKVRARLFWRSGYVGLQGLRGYEKSLKRIEGALIKMAFARRLPALENLGLRRGQSAHEAFTRIAQRLLEVMEANEAGVLADLDVEFLHDFRVSLRRTRSLLSQLRAVFAPAVFERWRAAFKETGTYSGEQRDLDVWLESLQRCADRALLERLNADRAAAHGALCRYLRSARWRNLKKAWHEALQSPPDSRRFSAAAAEPIEEVAAARLKRQFKRVIQDGRAITPASPPQSLHTLRIDCKKLRYLLEFFEPLFPATAALIAPLKQLQEVLGNHQDACVQIERLQTLQAGMPGRETLQTLSALTIEAEKARLLWRGRFAGAFARFDRAENRRIFAKEAL
ncbi:MAG: CHAD domain-containing protein [Campylobacterales bacterium]